MTLVRTDISPLLTAGLKTAFFESYEAAPASWQDIVTVIPSDKDRETYAWLGALPGMREFVDERQPGALFAYSYTIQNKTWESTLSIDRTAIEDDLYGQIALRVKSLGAQAKRHLDELVFGLLASGFVNLGYDGAAMFGAHGTQTNKGTDSLSALTLQSAITAMMKIEDDQGKPAGAVPDTLVVPPDLHWEALSLLNSVYYPDSIAGAGQDLAANPLKGTLALITSPYLTNATNWFLLDTKRTVRPLVLQMRVPLEFDALEGHTETGFLRDQYLYGVRARYNCGFGDWRAAFGSQVS